MIHARGEREAAQELGEAAAILEEHPAALQLRVLSTMTDVAAEKSSTLIFPLLIELLRWVEASTGKSQS